MLFRCSTPPATSDRFVLPVRKRLMVTGLFPNASRKEYGNSAAANGSSMRAVTACSISTGFIRFILYICQGKHGHRCRRIIGGDLPGLDVAQRMRPVSDILQCCDGSGLTARAPAS